MGYNIFISIFVLVLCIKPKIDLAVVGRKYFHQPDLSEHCKRRVVPSVFLGNQVMEANSHVMQFSQLEVPYSCFISIRAESGYNIILVIELQSEYSLLKACSKNRNQLIVYELGETFGGYWGPQPNFMMEPRTRNYTQYYTIQTTPAITKTKRTNKYKDLTLKGPMQTSNQTEATDKEPDYIRMEVPLVNVSGNLQLVGQARHTYNAEEIFDFIYDVTPRNGVEYETSIMPLLQFSIRPQKIEGYDKTQRYELDYDVRKFTPDFRLTTKVFNRKMTSKKKKWFNNRRYYNSKKKNNAPYLLKDTTHNHQNSKPYYIKTLLYRPFNTKFSVTNNISSDINSFNNESVTSKLSLDRESSFHEKESTILIIDDQTTVKDILKNNNTHIKEINFYDNNSTKVQTEGNSFINNTPTSTTMPFETGTMVDHESWENIVQAAPVMAVVLNKTDIYLNNNKTKMTNQVRQKTVHIKQRKKRHIQALLIENSRPRNLTTKRAVSTEIEQVYRLSDLHDLARLVELQDDEIVGRVALRYLRNYLGSALFNMCDMSEPKARHTFLFNASRIVIALNNFTLDRMLLVATPAQSVLSSMSRCPPGSLECQAVGSRVCIDSTNSCDGIPNCGSYDIYDEDRLLCGTSNDLQFNVYLATLTFLAVLLTILYIVHYWVRRCIPGVSEAFFIYTDGSENTLYLDTIMRSPMDTDDASCKFLFSGHFFEDDLYQDNQAGANGNMCKKLLRKCCAFLLFKRKRNVKLSVDIIDEYEYKPEQLSKRFSFTELELRKYAPTTSKDQEIQTGESIEPIKNKDVKSELRYEKEPLRKTYTFNNYENYANELSLIKFAKETKSLSSQSVSLSVDKTEIKLKRHAIPNDEKEIRNTLYDDRSNRSPLIFEAISKTSEVCPERPKVKVETKCLRFEEEPTMIPLTENEESEADKNVARRSVLLGTSDKNKQEFDMITETREASSAAKDFVRFWGVKGKKGKRKEKRFSIKNRQ
ncbi:unnamed protein product [Euphydryas editha]|uniref:CUB domain-containing protein n=1 Tax=Euphydryas editha TaxID=104508 RepID=A0AAU9UJV8_EUPED|nr:unnamed protein product [Euphydryas editha]